MVEEGMGNTQFFGKVTQLSVHAIAGKKLNCAIDNLFLPVNCVHPPPQSRGLV